MDNEPAIPFSLSPEGEEYEIEQAERGIQYFCPICRQRLDQRRGQVNRDYFAHSQGATDMSCPWRTVAGLHQSICEMEEKAIQRATSKRIRLFLQVEQGRTELALFGSIHPMPQSIG